MIMKKIAEMLKQCNQRFLIATLLYCESLVLITYYSWSLLGFFFKLNNYVAK